MNCCPEKKKYYILFRYFNGNAWGNFATGLPDVMAMINSEAKELSKAKAQDAFPVYVVIEDKDDGGKIAGVIYENGEFVICPFNPENYACMNRSLVGSASQLDLLRTYMEVRYPRGLYAVLDFYSGGDSQELQMQLFYAFCEEDCPDPPPGLCIWKISREFKAKIMSKFNKSGFDIWIFENGRLIDETR